MLKPPIYRLACVLLVLVCLWLLLSHSEAARHRPKRGKKGRAVAPTWRKGPPKSDRIEAREGKTVAMKCAIRGRPRPEISWLLNGRPLPTDQPSKYKVRRNQLIVRSLTTDDIAHFTCVAENKHGHLNFTYKIRVLEHQTEGEFTVRLPPKSKTAYVGDDVIFQCISKDYPRPSVYWMRNTAAFARLQFIPYAKDKEVLVLHNITKEDAGEYRCERRRGDVKKSLKATLTVITQDETMPFEPGCSLHVRRKVMVDEETGCSTAEPVDMHYCMGSCGRSSYFPKMVTSRTSSVKGNQTCSCCIGLSHKMRFLELKCPGGRTETGYYKLLYDCKCFPCEMDTKVEKKDDDDFQS